MKKGPPVNGKEIGLFNHVQKPAIYFERKKLLRSAYYILPQNKFSNTKKVNMKNSHKTKENKVDYLSYP